MAMPIQEPFKMEIEGHVGTVSESDAVGVMMKQSALTYITEKVLGVSNKRHMDDNNEQGSNKQQVATYWCRNAAV